MKLWGHIGLWRSVVGHPVRWIQVWLLFTPSFLPQWLSRWGLAIIRTDEGHWYEGRGETSHPLFTTETHFFTTELGKAVFSEAVWGPSVYEEAIE